MMFSDHNDHDPGFTDSSAWAAKKLLALQAYREQGDSDYSDDDSDSHNDSLENIYNEIDQLQMMMAQRNAAPAPPAPRPQHHYPQLGGAGMYSGNDFNMPSVTTSGAGGDHDQLIVLKNLPKANDGCCEGPFIDTLVIKEDVDVEYDAQGFPYVVPRPQKVAKANVISVPNPNEGQSLDASKVQAEVPLGGTHTFQVDKPDPPPCPQHGPVHTQGCPRHGVHCQQHCGAHAQQQAHPDVAHVGPPAGGACQVHGQPQPQPTCQVHGGGPHVHGGAPHVHGGAPHVHGGAPHVHGAGPHVHQHPPQHVVQMGQQPTKQVVVRKRAKKGKTLFEKLIG